MRRNKLDVERILHEEETLGQDPDAREEETLGGECWSYFPKTDLLQILNFSHFSVGSNCSSFIIKP